MRSILSRFLPAILVLLFTSCDFSNSKTLGPEYELQFSEYKSALSEGRVKYLQLAGLFKFNAEEHKFGSALGNSFLVESPSAALNIGTFKTNSEDSTIEFTAAEDAQVLTEDKEVIETLSLDLDEYGSSQMLYNGDMKWRVITRSGSYYLRVWDMKHPMVDRFNGYARYPLNGDFIVEGEFSYFDNSQEEEVRSQLGVNASTTFIGSVTFEFQGQSFDLRVGQNGFTMVMDETSGNDTYGGGRYIYLDLPEEDGPVTIDFNKLYNPPCSFSQYTTCLYPPEDNYLPFDLEAGEMIRRL